MTTRTAYILYSYPSDTPDRVTLGVFIQREDAEKYIADHELDDATYSIEEAPILPTADQGGKKISVRISKEEYDRLLSLNIEAESLSDAVRKAIRAYANAVTP